MKPFMKILQQFQFIKFKISNNQNPMKPGKLFLLYSNKVILIQLNS